MRQSWKLAVVYLLVLVLLLGACTGNSTIGGVFAGEEAGTEPSTTEPSEVELGPNGFRMIHLTEEARDIVLEDFDYLVEIILENAPTLGIAERRLGMPLEEFLAIVRDYIDAMPPLESFTALIMDERWEEIPDDPLYIAADYLTTILLMIAWWDLEGLGHFGPTSLDSFESMFLGNAVIQYDPEAAEFTGDIRDVERVLAYFNEPATLWLYGTDPSTFDLTTDLSDIGSEEEDNLTIEIIEPGQIAHLHIASFMNSPSFDSEVLYPFYEEIQDFEHLIIDIRGNGGGWRHYVTENVVAMLIDEPIDFRYYELHTSGARAVRAASYSMCEECLEREAQRPIAEILAEENFTDFREEDLYLFSHAILRHAHIEPDEDNIPFGGQIWLLVDENSASASEYFAKLALYSGFATVVGHPTAGVTGVMTTFVSLPNTGVLFRVDLGSIIDASGRFIEEYGVQPDITIARNEDALAVVLALIDGRELDSVRLAPEQAIIGTWICLDDSVPHQWACELTFDENGRFVDRDGDFGSFTIDGDVLVMEFDDFLPTELGFHIDGDELTLTLGRNRVVLVRQ